MSEENKHSRKEKLYLRKLLRDDDQVEGEQEVHDSDLTLELPGSSDLMLPEVSSDDLQLSPSPVNLSSPRICAKRPCRTPEVRADAPCHIPPSADVQLAGPSSHSMEINERLECPLIFLDGNDVPPRNFNSEIEIPCQSQDSASPIQTQTDFSWINLPFDLDDDPPPQPDQATTINLVQCEDFTLGFPEDSVEEETSAPQQSVCDAKTVPLYPGADITKLESLIAILTFANSENISGSGLDRLLSLISLHLPKPNKAIQSNYQLHKMLDTHVQEREGLVVYYFCSICYNNRSSDSDLCDICTDEKRSVHYFLSLPLVPQIQTLFKRAGFVEDIHYKARRVKQHPNNIEDIFDSELYREAENTILSSATNISLMWNTDGVQIYNSSSYSLWPWYFVINELPPATRFLSENMLLAGIWDSTTKPHPNIFLQPIFHDVTTLQAGIDVKFHGEDNIHKIKVMVLNGTCDAPARALFLNMKSHSGFYSCHVCHIRGEKSPQTGDVTVFPYVENVPLRNMEEYRQQVEWAVQNRVLHNKTHGNEEACGIKGPTLLSYLVHDLFASTGIDSMHCLYLGLMRQMLHLWFDSAFKNEPFSLYTEIRRVTSRLLQMTPPHFIQRFPQSIEKLIYWKATELRAFLFYLSLCLLCDIMKEDYFNHFKLLVHGASLLNSSSISQEDIELSQLLLCQFVSQFQVLYGLRQMSHNLHMVLHLSAVVQRIGPLWSNSCFQFEDMNGRLTKLIHGTRHAGLQIHSNLTVIRDLPLLIRNLQDGVVKDYCNQVHKKRMKLKVSAKISDGIYSIGVTTPLRLSDDSFNWISDLLLQPVSLTCNFSIDLFHRLLKDNLLYVSASYGRGVRKSCFVKYLINETVAYGRLECFARIKECECMVDCSCPTKYVAIITKLEVSFPFSNFNVPIKHLFQSFDMNGICKDVVSVHALQLVLYKIEVSPGNVYLCEPLNKYEMQ